MATRRRIGVSTATTEAARRQLMQPVPCWEKVWTTPTENGSAGLKIYKWVKTEKTQQFSDDEGGADEPLAPLPDEPEVVEGDEDLEQDENAVANNREESTAPPKESEPPSKLPSPKPQLTMSLQPSDAPPDDTADDLDASLKPMDVNMDKLEGDDGMELDMSGLGPDGLGLEASHDLSQMEGADALLGGQIMDQTEDPFVGN